MPRELLPDLISEILLHLPAKSLLRFRCLSSSLGHEIDSSNFAQLHLERSIDTKTHRKLILTRSKISYTLPHENKDIFSADFDNGLKKAHKIHNQFTELDLCNSIIIGTCHGLILFSAQQHQSSDPELFLWNPTIRRIKKLPHCSGGLSLSAGLGYDSASNDYKVVSIFPDHKTVKTVAASGGVIASRKERSHKVWVYSLKSNSWRYAQHLNLNVTIFLHPEGFANGFLYWQYWECYTVKLGCFDLANEVYITLPEFYSPRDDGLSDMNVVERDTFSINIVEGDVLMNRNRKEAQVHEFYSYVVDNGRNLVGGGGNWNKAFRFEARRLYVSPLAYSKDGACVLIHIHKDIFWYDMEKKTRHRVKFLRGMNKSFPFDCYVLWESLVSLGNDGAFQV